MDLDHLLNTPAVSDLAGLRRLEMDSEDLTELARPPVLSVPVLLVVLPPPPGVVPRFKDLKRKERVLHFNFKTDICFLLYLVEELILGWLPPFKLLIGFRSPNRLLLLRGFTIVLDEAERSFRRPFVRSFDRSRIFVNAPRGFSGGRLEENEMKCGTIFND